MKAPNQSDENDVREGDTSVEDQSLPPKDARQRELDLTAARQHTADLRQSAEPRWERLRARLEQARIRVEDAAIASKNTEDVRLEFGLLVTRDGRSFSFEFDFLRDEQGHELTYEDARVTSWEELDERARTLYEPRLEPGRALLEGEAPAR